MRAADAQRWASLEMTKEEYESQGLLLVGHRIANVRYHEIAYSDKNGAPAAEPGWNKNPAFDSLDYGVDFDFDDGSMCHVTWGAEFEHYGLSIQRTPQQYLGTIRAWTVTHESRWQPSIGQPIAAVDVYWSWVQYEGDSKRIEYPQSLRLTFESRAQVYLSALEVRDNGFRMGLMDHITIFFDGVVAEQYGAWPVGSPQRERHKKNRWRRERRGSCFSTSLVGRRLCEIAPLGHPPDVRWLGFCEQGPSKGI